MQMNRLPRSRNDNIRQSHFSEDPALGIDCKQILQHVQHCPVCQHIFTLPSGLSASALKSQNPSLPFLSTTKTLEIPITTLFVFAILIIIVFIYIIKTARSY